MIVIPAIDLHEGRCVRLIQGDFRQATVYGDDPVAMAQRWQAEGADRLHIVDLDGSREGRPCHEAVIRRIVAETGMAVEVGGGVRGMGTVDAYLAAGVSWVILGTAALREPAFVHAACRAYPGRVILGIDAAGGRVAVQGWTETSTETAADLARRFVEDNPAALVYTDILRDGMQTGVNLESTRALAAAVGIPVIASGGVAGIEDIARIKELEPDGVIGVIVGKALYAGGLSLAAAIDCARGFPENWPACGA